MEATLQGKTTNQGNSRGKRSPSARRRRPRSERGQAGPSDVLPAEGHLVGQAQEGTEDHQGGTTPASCERSHQAGL